MAKDAFAEVSLAPLASFARELAEKRRARLIALRAAYLRGDDIEMRRLVGIVTGVNDETDRDPSRQ